ncbi:YebC/PmpR family DNA-binding transcriptional regulator [Geomicrobium sp. JCM 19039]|uniref:YebC/PmpR family DNA-binding transcriptional regulator n=1 Tax=Geomicrobium sp. JCM 19039 TaxID=1460636 RepID=UPI00045F3CFC|nr:YebC/PmpR family DNA-binding transcriptional regulator [Geomicrobium sp. JCM 19039]GAK11303.1 hypothetical protein JCM19039_989 [Geomicrobium sp. JCM 19039]
MAGHSKWNNIKRRKEAQDSKRAKVFTKITKEIFASVRAAGDDPDTNLRLRQAIQKAKAANLPADNIERTIKKAAGNQEDVTYYELTYEGYGPGGAAIFVQVLTDNKNRVVADLRHAFSRNGGNLGEDGCVAFLFQDVGILEIAANSGEEEEVMLDAIEAGASEFELVDDQYMITTEPKHIEAVKLALEAAGYKVDNNHLAKIPLTTTTLDEEQWVMMDQLIDRLEDNDDVQNVYYNAD